MPEQPEKSSKALNWADMTNEDKAQRSAALRKAAAEKLIKNILFFRKNGLFQCHVLLEKDADSREKAKFATSLARALEKNALLRIRLSENVIELFSKEVGSCRDEATALRLAASVIISLIKHTHFPPEDLLLKVNIETNPDFIGSEKLLIPLITALATNIDRTRAR